MNLHSIQPFTDEPQITNIHHVFSYIQTCHFRCPDTWDDYWENMSLFVGQGKSIQRHKPNVQLYSAMKRQSRYLRTIDNPKFWKGQL